MPTSILRLHRPRLAAARALWIVLTSMILLYLVAGLPRLLIYDDLPCEAGFWPDCNVMETGLRSLGLNWGFFAWYSVLGVTVVCILIIVLSGLLAWRKRSDPATLLFSVALLVTLVMNVNYDLPEAVVQIYPAARGAVFVLSYLGQISMMVMYAFPDGHFVPGWTRWLAIVFSVLSFPSQLGHWLLPSMGWLAGPVDIISWLIVPVTLAYSLAYRYRKAANQEQRQQIKWIVLAVASSTVLVVIDALVYFAGSLFDSGSSVPTSYAVYQTLVSPTVNYMAFVLFLLGFYVAILRHRLWDIDLFINRSLVYSGLTVLLGLVIVGIFAATQTLLGIMVKNMQAGAAGIVALIVAIALFVPVRDRLQRFVDSRLYGVNPSHERAVQAAIAQERDRLSQELHDSVTQSLYGLTIMAESCQRLARDDEEREPLAEMGDVARQALKEMRLLIHELRPPVLAEEGLLSALHQRLAAVERRSGIEASLVIDKVVDLPVAVEEALYHIAVEALNNAIKHAAATSVLLSFHTSDTWVELEIADDGKGFDPGADSSSGGMGLAGMHKRAEELGGTLTIHSVPGQGTKVTARIPYHKAPGQHRTRPGSQSSGEVRLAE